MLYVAVMAGKNRCQCQKESHSPLIVGVRANTKQWQAARWSCQRLWVACFGLTARRQPRPSWGGPRRQPEGWHHGL